MIDKINGLIVELLLGSTPRAASVASVGQSPGPVLTDVALQPIATEAITLTSLPSPINRIVLENDSVDSVFRTWESPASRRDTRLTRLAPAQPIVVKKMKAKSGEETLGDVFDHRFLIDAPDAEEADWNEAVDQAFFGSENTIRSKYCAS